MERQVSFTRQEKEVLPNFRQRINSAESTEDIKKFFDYTSKELFERIFSGEINFSYGDVELMVDREPYFRLSANLSTSKPFKAVWDNSDLQFVVSRFAKTAVNKCKHLDKHPEKTDAKIRN